MCIAWLDGLIVYGGVWVYTNAAYGLKQGEQWEVQKMT
jgi:hypothetical protein